MYSAINVCLLRIGSLSCFAARNAHFPSIDTMKRLKLSIQLPKVPALKTISRFRRRWVYFFWISYSIRSHLQILTAFQIDLSQPEPSQNIDAIIERSFHRTLI
eukprot:IDg16453t1